MTSVFMSPFAVADKITFFAPASICFISAFSSRNTPVDSMTTSTSNSPQGNWEGSFSAYTLIFLPSTMRESSSELTSASKIPCTESYFSRCASICASVKSLTATISISSCFLASLITTLPIRPNPLIAILIVNSITSYDSVQVFTFWSKLIFHFFKHGVSRSLISDKDCLARSACHIGQDRSSLAFPACNGDDERHLFELFRLDADRSDPMDDIAA